jgi:hypothetical protein
MPTGLDLFRPSAFLRRSETQPEEKVAIDRYPGSDEQMFGADEQVRHGGQSD